MRSTRLCLLAGCMAALGTLSTSTALAAFPGENGRIAYTELRGQISESGVTTSGGNFTILPNGVGRHPIGNQGDTLAWSPDGRQLVVSGSSGVYTMDADGGNPTRILADAFSRASASFSPSGRRILFAAGKALRTIRTDGTKPRQVFRARGGRGQVDYPTFSPNGRRIAFAGRPAKRYRRGGIWTVRRDGSRLRRLTSNPVDKAPDYRPDGRRIVFVRDGCCNRIRVMRSDGSRQRPLPRTLLVGAPAYAPDGNRIAVSIDHPVTMCSDIFTMSKTGKHRRPVTDNFDRCTSDRLTVGWAGSPSWQPLPDAR